MESTVITADRAHAAEASAPHGPVAAAPLTHEFNETENDLISGLAARMHLVGLFTLGVGLFVIMIGTILVNVPSILSGTLYSVIGLWTDRASESFKKISETRGKDASHLIRALHDLKNLYTLQVWICTFIMASAVVGMIVLFIQKNG